MLRMMTPALTLILFLGAAISAPDEPVVRLTRVVPEGAVFEYRVPGSAPQTIRLQPGTYEIVIRRVR